MLSKSYSIFNPKSTRWLGVIGEHKICICSIMRTGILVSITVAFIFAVRNAIVCHVIKERHAQSISALIQVWNWTICMVKQQVLCLSPQTSSTTHMINFMRPWHRRTKRKMHIDWKWVILCSFRHLTDLLFQLLNLTHKYVNITTWVSDHECFLQVAASNDHDGLGCWEGPGDLKLGARWGKQVYSGGNQVGNRMWLQSPRWLILKVAQPQVPLSKKSETY